MRHFLLYYEGFRYIEGGCNALMKGLMSWIADLPIDIYQGCRVESVHYGPDHSCRCVTSIGEYFADRVISGQFSNFSVYSKEGHISIPRRSIHNNIHMMLKVEGSRQQPFTYIEIRNSPILRALSDVGSFCSDVKVDTGVLVLCCQLTREANKKSVCPQEVLDALVGLGLVCRGSSVLASHIEHYEADFIADGDLDDVNASLGPVTILHTHNLSPCIARYLDRWIGLLDLPQAA